MSIKICSSCGCEFRDEDIPANFNRHPQTADGLRPDCKTCQADESSIYYDRNRFAILDRKYERYHGDPEYNARMKAYNAQKKREQRARQREQLAASA